ncbi:glycosyltransferase [Chryseobacterium gambrini]|uniref:Glycosyltransferase like family protein n=1 Tax=Chryseobacterium gambrini TaxID=373672 RepID=A0A1N7MRW3_9FLAO|nr:glycosyltransferase [Chryseobacterium gambrini]SIS88874.1 Glycosyltransferase like family protein [Chryseobacterium gambrini]
MLSIIISSYQKHYFDQLTQNIRETIGEDFQYEIIQMWNPNVMSIMEAYNSGEEKSRFENLLFIHEDVVFHTHNWGERLIKHLNKPGVGIIGISGSSYVPTAPSSWTVSEEYQETNILESTKENPIPRHTQTTKKNMNKVLGVDGVFLAVKKSVFKNYKFNEDLGGFHGYDLDISLRISKKLQNYVINDILIEHFSMGNLNKEWFDTNIKIRQTLGSKFHKKKSKTELSSFLGFLTRYFMYYPVTKKTILQTLKFYPFKYLTIAGHYVILKKYFNYILYYSDINKNNKKHYNE